MSDLISRQALLIALHESGLCTNNWLEVRNEINALPSAECDDCIWHVCNYNKVDWDGKDGYISKRDAINAIENTDAEITAGEWDELTNAIKSLPSADRPKGECRTCARNADNGGFYDDGRTRCPIQEHYALLKDGYCHLYEPRMRGEEK